MIRADKFLPPADRLALLLDAEGIRYTREYLFAEQLGRRWRADFFVTASQNGNRHSAMKVLLEVEGGVFSGGRHVRGTGFSNDIEKYAEAQCLGFVVLRVTTKNIDSGQAVIWLKKLIGVD